MHALLITGLTLGIVVTVAGSWATTFWATAHDRRRLGLLALAATAVGLALTVACGIAVSGPSTVTPHTAVTHFGYGKF